MDIQPPEGGKSAEVKVSAPSASSDLSGRSDGVRKSAHRKADLRLLAWYTLVHVFLKFDSHNVISAAIMNVEAGDNIQHQLNLNSGQWAWIIGIFYYPFLVFDPISTLLLKKYTPRKWMSRIMLSWGIVSMCQAATHNFAGLLVCRFMLGIAEAGFLPGMLYHLAFWYPAHRLSLRVALLIGATMLAGSVGGIFAYAVSFLNGKCGLAGWQWLFILEGMPPVICGIYTFFFLPNYPPDAAFLTDAEKTSVLADLPETQPNSNDKTWALQQFKELLASPTTYTFFLIWLCHGIGAKGVMTVLPTVLYELDFAGSAETQLMAMPLCVIGSVFLILTALAIRRQKLKTWVAALCLEIFICLCYVALITVGNPIARYVILTLAGASAFCVNPILWPERIGATHGTTSAGIAIGLTNMAGEIHGIVGPQVYRSSFGPMYRISFEVALGLLVTATISIAVTWFLVRRQGKQEHECRNGDVQAPGFAESESNNE